MEYYVVTLGTNIVLFMFLFNLLLFIIAVIECYVFICSYSLYKEYKSPTQELNVVYTTVNTVDTNTNVNHSPPYNDCESGMRDQMAEIDLKQNP